NATPTPARGTNSGRSGATSSRPLSAPTGRSSTTCADPAPPGAPSTTTTLVHIDLIVDPIVHRSPLTLACAGNARNHGRPPGRANLRRRHFKNGPSDDAASLCNSRRLSERRPQAGGLVAT